MENKRVSGWNMLDSYSEGQAIYGRDTEIASIKESVFYNIQTFLYGKSGIGKTSLLQAGVFPELRRANYFPVVIRLAFYNNEPLNRVVKRLVEEEAESENSAINKAPLSHYVIDDTDVTNCSLYEYFAKVRFEDENHTPYIPVLVLDQFEETINNEEQWQRTVDFLKDDLYSLMDNSNIIRGASLPYTNYRVVFSMREDYLYCLEDIVDRFSLWELRYNRFRIKALDDERAEEVIRRTSGVNGLEYGKEEKIIKLIIQLVKNNSGTRFTEINTALLSLICSLLHENSIDGCIRYNDLRKVNTYINSYYDEVCSHIGGRATRYLEQHLLTADGRRSSIDESEALASHKIKPEHFDYLVEKRLVRKIKTDSSSARYEYIHDLFAKIVHKRKKEDRKRWAEPEYRSISKSLDFIAFVKRIFATGAILSTLFVLWLYYHVTMDHPGVDVMDALFNLDVCINNFSYWAIFAIAVYWIPLCVKRLHAYRLSGWHLLLLPFLIFIGCSKYYLVISDEAWNWIIGITGLGVSYYLRYLIKASQKRTHYEGYSKEYEAAWNGATISNIGLIKMISIELLCWIICCVITDLIYYGVSDRILWKPFELEGNLPLFDKFNMKISLPMALAQLPFILCFSCALRARVRSLGRNPIHAYIPYWNILVFFVGLLPDSLLCKMKLLKARKADTEAQDDVFSVVYDDFLAKEETPKRFNAILAKEETTKRFNATAFYSVLRDLLDWRVWLMVIVPLYGIVRALNKNNSDRTRVKAAQCAPVSGVISSYWLFVIWVVMEPESQLVDDIFYIGGLLFLVVGFGMMLYFPIALRRGIIAIVKANPTYTPEQISKVLTIYPNAIERTIKGLIKEGILTLEEVDGVVCWKVNEKQKNKMNKTIEN